MTESSSKTHSFIHLQAVLLAILPLNTLSRRLMLGFMVVSSLLSMWISNSATTAMMLPIAQAVLEQLKATEALADQRDLQAAAEENPAFELESRQTKEEKVEEKRPDDNVQLEEGEGT